MNEQPELPALVGASPSQAAVALQIACNAGLNLGRAYALVRAQGQRRLRPNEQAELDQVNAGLAEALTKVTANCPVPVAPRATPLRSLAAVGAHCRALPDAGRAARLAAGKLRRQAAEAGELLYRSNRSGEDSQQAYEHRSRCRAAEAAAGNPLYRNTAAKGPTS